MYKQSAAYIPTGVYRCLCSLMSLRVSYAFRLSRTKRVIYAFSIYGVPQAPQRHFFSAFPSGFYTTFGVKTVQKYTFSPKLQIIGEEIHFNGAHFSKNENAKMQKCCQQIRYDISPCVNFLRKKLCALMYGIRFINDFYPTH